MSLQSELIDLLTYGLAEDEKFADTLPEDERAEPGSLEHWAARDNLAHIAAWKEHMAANMRAMSAGQQPKRTDDIDATNAVFYHQHAELTLPQVLAYDRQATHALLAELRKFSDEELRKPYPVAEVAHSVWRAFAGDGVIHPILHLASYLAEHGRGEEAVKLEKAAGEKLLVLDPSPEWRGTQLYNLACIQARSGLKNAALENLRQALSLRPDIAPYVKKDPDLLSLHGDPNFEKIP
jgi:tetratricopeptide (TPR) repeat protein